MIDFKQHARSEARRVIAEYGDVSVPVPVEKIIKKRSIRIQFSPLDQELSGMALIKDGIGVIGVNALHHPNRQRFTMAHELGHHILHWREIDGTAHVDKGFAILLRDTEASQGTNRIEIEANNFASELLMPTQLLEPLVDEKGFDLDDVELLQALAKRFKVSLSALQFRLLAMN